MGLTPTSIHFCVSLIHRSAVVDLSLCAASRKGSKRKESWLVVFFSKTSYSRSLYRQSFAKFRVTQNDIFKWEFCGFLVFEWINLEMRLTFLTKILHVANTCLTHGVINNANQFMTRFLLEPQLIGYFYTYK